MHSRLLLAVLSSLAALPAAAQTVMYRAARIYTMEADSVYTTRPAVAVTDGRVVAVGDSASVAAATRVDRVDNRFLSSVIVPGFVEAHTHFQLYGIFAATPYVGYWNRPTPGGTLQPGVKTLAALQAVLRAELVKKPRRPIFAYGADPIYWGGSRLTAQELNAVSGTVPIMVQLGSGHIVVANDTMLKLVRAQDTTAWKALVASGQVVQENGQPTGELDELAAVEQAFTAFVKARPGFLANEVRAMGRAANLMRRAGITTATDLLFGGASRTQEVVARDQYGVAAATDPAFPRVFLGYNAAALAQNWGADAVPHLRGEAQRDTGKIRMGPVKIIYDGSIQGYTAVLSGPYAQPPAPGANPIWNVSPPATLLQLAQPFWNAGFRLAVHVNGDSATAELIRVIRQLQADSAWAGHRTTFEHNQAARADQYDSIQALGAVVNLFPGHIWYYGPQHERYTLGARAADIAAADWPLARGIPFSLHSDAPVTPAVPLFSAWSAVNRVMPTTPSDSVLGPQHRISVGQALRAITMGGAYLLGAESEIGSIRSGKSADFAVLGQDPFAVAPAALCAVPVVGTVIRGVVWQPPTPTQPYCPQ